MKNLALLFITIMFSAQSGYAGFTSPEQERIDRQKSENDKNMEYIASLKGKNVWYSKTCSAYVNILYASPPTSLRVGNSNIPKYIPDHNYEKMSFENVQTPSTLTGWGWLYTLKLSDGSLAYFNSDTGYGSNKIEIQDPSSGTGYGRCWFSSDPNVYLEKEKADQAAELKAQEAEKAEYNKRIETRARKQRIQESKPGARIGMTKKQVLTRTSWGEPDDINTTTSGSGEFEQWIYGGGNYLYFKNGILVSIQN